MNSLRVLIYCLSLVAYCNYNANSKKAYLPARELSTQLARPAEVHLYFNRMVNSKEYEKYKKLSFATNSLRNHPADLLRDENLETAWCYTGSGAAKASVYLMAQPMHVAARHFLNAEREFELTIVNGFAFSEEIYLANNRIKKGILELFEARLGESADAENILGSEPVLNGSWEIDFEDKQITQQARIVTKSKLLQATKYSEILLMARFTVIETFPGSRYTDTCISELHFGAPLF